MDCPFCGGKIARVEETNLAGKREYSLCCDVPLEVIDNYEVFSALPPALQRIALKRGREEHREWLAQNQRAIEAYKRDRPARLAFDKKYAHLLKGHDADQNDESGLFERSARHANP